MLRQAPNLSVRQLAEFVCRSGDLYAQRTSKPVEPEAGLRAQQHIQRGRREQHETYQHEVSVLCEFDLAGASRSLRGRIDGCYRHASGWVVEEFKCVATPPDQPDAVDWGQALIYAAMWSHQQNLDAYIDIHLIYIEAETLREHPFRQRVSTAAAQAWLALMLLCVAVRWRRHCWSVMRRETFSAALSFPLPQFRRGQQALARRVYQAVRDRENLLLEAPTGSGKSLGVLFPAVKSLRNHQQLFFLTARNSGAQAALLSHPATFQSWPVEGCRNHR